MGSKNQILRILFGCIFLLLATFSAIAQSATDARRADLEAKDALEMKIRTEDKRLRQMVEEQLEPTKIAEAKGRPVKYFSENELPADEKKLVMADAALRAANEEFLRRPGTGLFKILSLQDNKLAVNDVRAQSAYPQIQGSGTYYSFAKKNHIPDEWTQIRLTEGRLQIGYVEMIRNTQAISGGMNQTFTYKSGFGTGLMTELGNVALDEIKPEAAPIRYLAALEIPNNLKSLKEKTKSFFQGIVAENRVYRAFLPAKVNTTYVLRSVLYKKTDSLIAFRILKQDNDGSLHILWKQLSSFPTPEIKGKQ